MQTHFKLLAVAALLGSVGFAQAASFTGSGYVQNFDSMGTTTTLPTDWTVWKVGTSHSSWATSIAATGASDSVAAMTQITTSPVTAALYDTAIVTSTKNASAYNIAHGTSTDRVLSTSPTGIDGNALQLTLTNTTGAAVNSVKISYDIDKFYDGTKQSSIDSAFPVGEELPGYQLFYSLNGGTWTNVSALNPVSTADGVHPYIAVGTPSASGSLGALDFSVTSVNNAVVTFGSAWANGQTLSLRWVDDNAVNISADQIIGLNNVSIAAVPEPETYAMLMAGLGLLGFVARRRA